MSHVINYDLPFVPEQYVHRIGRTARAGAEGDAIAFCTPEDRPLLRDIEKTIRMSVPVKDHALGKRVEELAPNHGWSPMGKQRPQGRAHPARAGKPQGQQAKPHRKGNAPNRNHSGGAGNGGAQTPMEVSGKR